MFADIYTKAFEAGIHRTVHAGEFGSSKNIRTAIRELHAERIGHGLNLYDGLHEDLASEVRDRGVHIECCPTSNVIFGVLDDLAKHPLPRMLHDGICVSISTDDPRVIHWELGQEYAQMPRVFDLDPKKLIHILLTSVDCIFRDDCKPYIRSIIRNFAAERNILYENC